MLQSFNSTKVARFGQGAVILRSRGDALTENQLLQAAPSIFATNPHSSRSERYTYIPTIDVLRGLQAQGFSPYEVRQGGSKDDEKRGFTKHMLRLRHASTNGELVAGDSHRELILLNAHDGTSSYQLMSGMFRVVCTNGLITCTGGQMQRIAHKGNVIDNAIEGAFQIIEHSEDTVHAIEDMRSLTLNNDEQEAFASAALELRYNAKDDNGEVKAAPVQPKQILASRRSVDKSPDLWTTFNRVQENLVQGGNGYVHRDSKGNRSYRHTRPVQSIDGNVTLNRALWVLANKMQELKAA